MLSHINAGTGIDLSIEELARTIAKITGFRGKITFDLTKPDGTLRKLLDVSRIRSLGWEAQISLEKGLQDTYTWFLQNIDNFRA